MDNYESLVKVRINELLSQISGERELQSIARQYVYLDILLYEWYCHLTWNKHFLCKQHEKCFTLVSFYSQKLYQFYETSRVEIKNYLADLTHPHQGKENTRELVECFDQNRLRSSQLLVYMNSTSERHRSTVPNQILSPNRQDLNDLGQEFLGLLQANGWPLCERWLGCNIYQKAGPLPSFTCLGGYQKVPNVLWYTENRYVDWLTLCHELGHVLHYNIAMESQSFYQFEPSILVKEAIAFFWEAMLLVYLSQGNNLKSPLLQAYEQQTKWYLLSVNRPHRETQYDSYYPLARYIGESLAMAVINGRISKQEIIALMQQGAMLNTRQLMFVANVKE